MLTGFGAARSAQAAALLKILSVLATGRVDRRSRHKLLKAAQLLTESIDCPAPKPAHWQQVWAFICGLCKVLAGLVSVKSLFDPTPR